MTIALTDAIAGGTWSSNSNAVASVNTTGIVTGGNAGNATITYSTGCGTAATATVTVIAAPTSITGPTTVCSGLTISLTDFTLGGTWSSANSSIALVDANGTVTGGAAGITTIAYSNGCGTIRTATVTVTGNPVVITGASTVCIGSNITLSNVMTGGTWSSSNTSIVTIGASSGTVVAVNGGTATITYSTGCGTAATLSVTATGPITGPGSVLVDSTIVLSDVSVGGTWTSSAPGIATVDASGNVTGLTLGTVVISYTNDGSCYSTSSVTVDSINVNVLCTGQSVTFTDTVGGGTWTSSNNVYANVGLLTGITTGLSAGTLSIIHHGASGYMRLFPITVHPLNPTSGPSSVCQGQTIVLTNGTSGGGTWSTSNTSIASVSANGTVSGYAGGGATITFTSSAGCLTTTSVTVSPMAPITGISQVCIGQTTILSNAIAGGTWSSSNPGYASVVANTGVVTGVLAGSPTIKYVSPAGCTSSMPISIVQLAATTGLSTVCQGQTITLNNASTGGGYWTSSNTSIATIASNGVLSGISSGPVSISFTTQGGCVATNTITVNAIQPISGSTTVCSGQTIALSEAVTGGTWSSASLSVATVNANGVVTGVSAGMAIINYSLSGCTTSLQMTIKSSPASITGLTSVCTGSMTALSDQTVGGFWSSDNTSAATISTGMVTAVSAGAAGITYTMTNGCYAATQVTISSGAGAITGSSAVCVGSAIGMSDYLGGGTWTVPASSIAVIDPVSGIVTGVSAGNTVVTYSLGTCYSTKNVVVNATPTAISGATNICSGSSMLSDAVAGGTWSSSNTIVATIGATNGLVSSVSAGPTVVTYSLAGGCMATTTVNISPLSLITGVTTVCAGFTTVLTDASLGGTWNSSNTVVANVDMNLGTVTGLSAGLATITYMAGAGCYVTTSLTVTATPAVITGTQTICAGSATTLFDATTGGVWSSLSSGIATVSSTGVVTGVSGGLSVISYVASGCPRTTTITVNPSLPINGPSSVCIGMTALLSDGVSGGTWTSSNNTYATVSAATGIVTGVVAGNVNISYTSPLGCVSYIPVTISTLQAITGAASVCGGQTLALYNNTVGGGVWSSGNTLVATVSSTGMVTGAAIGTTSAVSITFAVSGGCATTKTVTVNASVPISGATTVCTGQTTMLSNSISGGSWSSSNAGNATVVAATGVVTGAAAGTPTISYTVAGCISLTTVAVRALSTTTGTFSICQAHTTTLYNTTAGGGVWSSSNTSVATVNATGVVSGVSVGNTPILFTTGTGCVAIKTVTVSVCPSRDADSTTSVTTLTGIEDIKLFPNPNNGTFTVKGPLATTDNANVSIEITDMLGQLVYRNNFIAQSGNINEQIQLNNPIANSMYLVNIRSGSGQKIFHIVIER